MPAVRRNYRAAGRRSSLGAKLIKTDVGCFSSMSTRNAKRAIHNRHETSKLDKRVATVVNGIAKRKKKLGRLHHHHLRSEELA